MNHLKTPVYMGTKWHVSRQPMGQQKISEDNLESILKWMKTKTQHNRISGMLLKQGLGEIYSTKCLSLKRRMISS